MNTYFYTSPKASFSLSSSSNRGTLYPINKAGKGISEPTFSLAAFQKLFKTRYVLELEKGITHDNLRKQLLALRVKTELWALNVIMHLMKLNQELYFFQTSYVR